MEKKLMLAPSMGCCDLYDFGHQVKFIDEHADFLHIDIKDGNYVKTFGVDPDFMTVLKSCKTDGCTLNGKTSARLY